MKNSIVSVIMPAYNHELYIGEAIESVLNQSYTNFEFIIVNDGSTDSTERIIKSYEDERIKYIYQENQGAHSAINKGISMAKGYYISIINSDDVYHPKRLSTLVDTAEEENAKFIFTDLSFISEKSENINAHNRWYDKLKNIYDTNNSIEVTFLSGNITVTTSNFFFKSDIIKEIGQFKPYRYAHDYDFVLRVLIKYPEYFIYISDDKLLSYRLHSTNTIRESYLKVNTETIDLLAKNAPKFIEGKDSQLRAEATLKYIEELNEYVIGTIKQKDEEINNKDNLIRDILNTHSWKITAPLRWLYGIYLNRKNRRGFD
jgi:glycosyltransferase involved in cell wall biosynthesis